MSDKKQNVNLEEMMDKAPRTGSGISLDLTRPITEVPSNDGAETANVAANTPKIQVNPVQAGPVDMSNMAPMDIHSVLPKREKVNPFEASLYADLDAAVAREKESITARQDELMQRQREEFEERAEQEAMAEQAKEDDFALNGTPNAKADDDDLGLYGDEPEDGEEHVTFPNTSAPVRTTVNTEVAPEPVEEAPKTEVVIPKQTTVKNDKVVSILDMKDDGDLFDDEEAEAAKEEADVNNMLEDLKTAVKEKITPIRKSLDLSKFTIAQKSISAQKVMKLAVQSHQNVADWIMFSANRPLSVTGLSGPEILKLNPENSSRNRLNTFRDMYRIIYDHVYDANKPEFETWLKQIRFVDVQHIYFALYMATFGGSNFVNYTCPKCNKVFVQDIKFEDMVSYASEETKEKVRSILKMDTTTPSNDTYPVDLVQISNNYVFGLRTPSVWNVIMETASLSDQFLEKHADLIDVVSYIDTIYIIDEETMSLVPVDTKPDPNDQAKTSARRIKVFYDVIRTLSSEDYYGLRAKINEYDENSNDVSYKIPACKCPECEAEIPENKDIAPDNMLFTRHQLAAIGNM